MKAVSPTFLSLAWLLSGKSADAAVTSDATTSPSVLDERTNVTYQGLYQNDIEIFLNLRFGQDTSGPNRFKPPRPFVPEPGSTITAQEYGPACPQSPNAYYATQVSEDCLSLNVARPAACNSTQSEQLPVLVWIFGGGLILGSNHNAATAPDALIAESVENGTPVIHVSLNYRLGGKCSIHF
jgi:carboxylesterase type B